MFGRWTAACVLWLAAALGPAAAQDPGRLVDATWLQRQLGAPELRVLDASPATLHKLRHIPGAVNVDLFAYGPQEPTRAEMQRRVQAWGLSARQRVVLADPGGTHLATRLFFDLLHHGFPEERLHVLDGGMARWVAGGGAVTAEPTPPPAPGDWQPAPPLEAVRSRPADFLAATGDRRQHVVEALDPENYFGQAAWFDRAGHVPRALMWPVADFFNADKTFKSPAEIRRMMDWLGIRDDQPVHTYCGGGIAASVPFFALRHIAGHPQVKLYPESQLGWVQDERDLPLWTLAEPHLLRDTAWLKTWGGRMMRQFGLQKATPVDVRTPEAFAQAHLPLAVNVPLAGLRSRLAQPAALAAHLAAAGLDPAHELVVMSDAGVDPAAALGVLALRLAGYPRVSVFVEGIDAWAAAGQAVERGAGAPPASARLPQAAAAPAAQLLADPAAVPGPHPRVFLASGRGAAAGGLPGPALALPYGELLGAGNRPRPAHELWQVLQRAKVPRFAELVVLADDPAEAALNQLLLQALGFGHVKLWLR